ncbi:hypothetical protein T484DRAFT_2784991 [Baffinella frigidus]|nr:hypothetical protein T484DRAFT_2784991 [Cryptophyta sp. CCMP2293]
MAGWRVGYLAYPSYIHDEILKAQDTIPTMATIISYTSNPKPKTQTLNPKP